MSLFPGNFEYLGKKVWMHNAYYVLHQYRRAAFPTSILSYRVQRTNRLHTPHAYRYASRLASSSPLSFWSVSRYWLAKHHRREGRWVAAVVPPCQGMDRRLTSGVCACVLQLCASANSQAEGSGIVCATSPTPFPPPGHYYVHCHNNNNNLGKCNKKEEKKGVRCVEGVSRVRPRCFLALHRAHRDWLPRYYYLPSLQHSFSAVGTPTNWASNPI